MHRATRIALATIVLGTGVAAADATQLGLFFGPRVFSDDSKLGYIEDNSAHPSLDNGIASPTNAGAPHGRCPHPVTFAPFQASTPWARIDPTGDRRVAAAFRTRSAARSAGWPFQTEPDARKGCKSSVCPPKTTSSCGARSPGSRARRACRKATPTRCSSPTKWFTPSHQRPDRRSGSERLRAYHGIDELEDEARIDRQLHDDAAHLSITRDER